MNRNRITLKESQLRQMISESVKKVLNELDWKTYASAAEKAYKPSNSIYRVYADQDAPNSERNERSRKFWKAAEDSLNRDYGYEKEYKSGNKGSLSFATPDVYPDSMYDDTMENPYRNKVQHIARKNYADGGQITDIGPSSKYYYNDHGYITYPDKESSWGYRCGDRVPKSDIYKGDRNFKAAIDKANDEIDNYNRGNYEYIKGKGWKLKK